MRISRMTMFGAALCLAGAGALGCGGSAPPPTTAPPASPAPTSEAPKASAAPWKDMDHAQRLDYMKRTVFPKMKDEFTAFDAKRYGEMNCGTCHGDGAKSGDFKMP